MLDVSVVMACRNRAEQIPVTFPTYPEVADFVLVDDGSTDDSVAVAKKHRPHIRIDYTHREGRYQGYPAIPCNLSVSSAMREEVIIASPEIAVAPDCLGLLAGALEPRSMVFARVIFVREAVWRKGLPDFGRFKGQDWTVTDWRKLKKRLGAHKPFPVYCGHERPVPYFFCGATHKSTWDELGGYDLKAQRGCDGRLATRALKGGVKVIGLGDAVAFHLEHRRT